MFPHVEKIMNTRIALGASRGNRISEGVKERAGVRVHVNVCMQKRRREKRRRKKKRESVVGGRRGDKQTGSTHDEESQIEARRERERERDKTR